VGERYCLFGYLLGWFECWFGLQKKAR
jgi:hypothetical protein